MENKIINDLTIGSDIEWGLKNFNTGEIVSAEGIIQGTKNKPFHFDPENHYYATSLDNVLAEGNIPPVTNAGDFYLAIEKLRKYIDNHVRAHNLITIAEASIRLDEKYLQTKNAREYGCSISYNAWTGDIVAPKAKKGDNNRAIGFHIHAGYTNPSEETNFSIIKACDLFLGIPSIIMEPINERKSTGYGQAGNCRHTSFGVEYRSLSSYFAASKELIDWSYNNFIKAIEFVNENQLHLIEHRGEELQRIINTENKEEAKRIVEEFNLEVI